MAVTRMSSDRFNTRFLNLKTSLPPTGLTRPVRSREGKYPWASAPQRAWGAAERTKRKPAKAKPNRRKAGGLKITCHTPASCGCDEPGMGRGVLGWWHIVRKPGLAPVRRSLSLQAARASPLLSDTYATTP